MSGFDDDFLAGPAPAPAPVKLAQGAAAAPSPSASSLDDFDGFGVGAASAQPEADFLSPEAADAAKATAQAMRAKTGAAMASAARASHDGARRLGQAFARVTPRQWATGLGVLALAIGVSFGVRWWMHRPATPAVAAAKTEVSAAPTSATASVSTPPVVTSPVRQKQAVPVTAATMPAPAIAPTSPPPTAVVHPASGPVVVSQKKDRWQVAHAADLQKSMQQHTEKTEDAWAKDQSARLDAFFKKKH